MGTDPLFLQLGGQVGGVAALKPGSVCKPVAHRVFPGIRHRLGHHLHADYLPGLLRQSQTCLLYTSRCV